MAETATKQEQRTGEGAAPRIPGTLRLLPTALYDRLCAGAFATTFAPDTTLASPGEGCGEVWVVVRGAVSVQETDEETGEIYPIAYLGKGEIYGTHCTREGATHRFHVVTASDVELAAIPRTLWAETLDADGSGLLAALQNPAIRRVLFELQTRAAPAEALTRLATALEPRVNLDTIDTLIPPGGQAVRTLVLVSRGAVRHGETLYEAGDVVALEALVMRTPCMFKLAPVDRFDALVLETEHLSSLLRDEPRLERAFRWWAAERSVRKTYGRPAVVTDRDHEPPEMDEEEEAEFHLPTKPRHPGALTRKPFFFQRDEMDCGAACMRMITRYHGHEVSYSGLKALARVSRYGTSLWDLSVAAEAMGYVATAVELDFDSLKRVDLPAVAHLATQHHFVVIWRVSGNRVVVGDPKFGNVAQSREQFEENWRGITLLLKPTDRLGEETRRLLEAKPEDQRKGLQRLWAYFKPFKTVFVHVLAASILLQIIGLVGPFSTQVILDRVLMGWDQHLLGLIAVVLIVTAVLKAVVSYSRVYLIFQLSAKLERIIVESLYRRLIRNHEFFSRFTTSDLLNRFGEVYTIKQFFVDNIVGIAIDLLMLFMYGLVLSAYSLQLTSIVVVVVATHLLVLWLVGRYIRGYTFMFLESYDRYRTHLMDSLKGHRVIRAHALEGSFQNKLSELLAPSVEHGFKAGLAGFTGASLFALVDALGAAALLLLGAQLVLDGGMSIGELIAFTMIAAQLSGPIARLAGQWRHWHRIQVNLHRVSDLLEGPDTDEGYDTAVMDLPTAQGHLVFENVTFHYPRDAKEKAKNALESCSFQVLPGEIVAICGRSGCGKSTLISLMLRLFDPQEGRIWIDGFNLRDLTPESIRNQFGMVTQEVTLFAGTIYDNIACGRQVGERAVIQAAKVAGAYEFVSELPYGFHTQIGERGLKLSGGQHQRIVIARALVTDPKILIFDEAMASLDPLSESLIHERLQEVIKGRTTIVISHRLSSLRNADRILVMDKGRIVEMGTHEQLIAREGLYLSLVQASPGWRQDEEPVEEDATDE